ncbi:NAD(P)-binding protein [Cryphonectria parasitica EP155]|uniref:NAD(P)-binding protein n=1 Tax=Cryphonectria parasitica (strain ATCC 38755 / EP155) TaxID=660469 RepID=A0A9P4Y5Y5_CRYP1|nr:NAD(P)-binding protein [Cryphonectria parasitica EP155]KAF3767153.1 NAD(P)-binding protein [Cryphonectria parasitica EP155]
MSKKYVLTGVGGGIGSVAADYAISIRQPDQQLVFSTTSLAKLPAGKVEEWRSQGVEVVEATYEDVNSLIPVFQGAEAIAWISTWAIYHRPDQGANILAAARAAGVHRVLYSSFVGAGLAVGSPEALARDVRAELPFLPQDHALTERLIRASGLVWNVQRNYLYQDNIPGLFSGAWKYCGDRWLNNSGGRGAAYVAREDCGRVFGALLLGKGEPNTAYHVSGPAAITDKEVFEYMNGKSGYKAEFVDVDDEELRAWWAERGMGTDALKAFESDLPLKLCQDDLLCCGSMVREGYLAEVHDTVEKLTGRKALSYQENFVKYEGLFPRNE